MGDNLGQGAEHLRRQVFHDIPAMVLKRVRGGAAPGPDIPVTTSSSASRGLTGVSPSCSDPDSAVESAIRSAPFLSR
ncbi:hypothetical protein AHiyo4_22980 [Arthrobacter sp. Hiyo4]|nr:hypothetical protein AHiyo4_22980 [Arthrobacter sp. Hiyo4]